MADSTDPIEDVQLTRENAIAYCEWLGNLAARALYDHGAITFFVDSEGDVRLEIPEQRVIRAGKKVTKKEE